VVPAGKAAVLDAELGVWNGFGMKRRRLSGYDDDEIDYVIV